MESSRSQSVWRWGGVVDGDSVVVSAASRFWLLVVRLNTATLRRACRKCVHLPLWGSIEEEEDGPL